MKLARSQRRTLLGHGLMKSSSAKKGLRKACVCVCREAGQDKRETLNAHETKRRDEVTKRMVSGEAITSSKEESLIH